jgi:hypothetical protein
MARSGWTTRCDDEPNERSLVALIAADDLLGEVFRARLVSGPER